MIGFFRFETCRLKILSSPRSISICIFIDRPHEWAFPCSFWWSLCGRDNAVHFEMFTISQLNHNRQYYNFIQFLVLCLPYCFFHAIGCEWVCAVADLSTPNLVSSFKLLAMRHQATSSRQQLPSGLELELKPWSLTFHLLRPLSFANASSRLTASFRSPNAVCTHSWFYSSGTVTNANEWHR